MVTSLVEQDLQRDSAPVDGTRSRPLRVCMIHYSHFDVDSRVQRQALALASRGDEVDSVCLGGSPPFTAGKGLIRVHPLGYGLEKPRHGARAYLSSYAGFFLAAFAAVSRLDRQREFDIVEAHNMPNFLTFAGIVPKLRGAAVLLDVHDTFPELFATKFGTSMDGKASRVMKIEEWVSAAFADGVIAVTDEARDRMLARRVGRGKFHVVMNTPDERVFGPPREPIELPDEGPLRAVYHGGMAPRFGVETLVQAAALAEERIPRLDVKIYGASQRENRTIGEFAESVAPNNVWVAPLPTPFAEIPSKLTGAHIGVVSTLDDEFTQLLLPVKLMEYVQMGLYVISSRLPVIENYFSDDEVRFYEPGSAESLAEALADVVENPEAARERAERASQRLTEISWARQRETYLSTVDGIVSHSRKARKGSR